MNECDCLKCSNLKLQEEQKIQKLKQKELLKEKLIIRIISFPITPSLGKTIFMGEEDATLLAEDVMEVLE